MRKTSLYLTPGEGWEGGLKLRVVRTFICPPPPIPNEKTHSTLKLDMLKVQDRKFQKQLQTTEDSSCLKTEVSEVNLPETSKRERGGKDAARARKRTVAHHLWARFYKGSSLEWDAAYQTKAHLYLYARVPGCALLTKQKLKLKKYIYIYKHK